jgi:hypothetical protein
VLVVIVGIMVLGLFLHALEPLHAGKGYFRQVGQLVAESTAPGDYVITESPWILHYSQVEGVCLRKDGLSAKRLLDQIRRSKATHLVLSDRTIRRANPGLAQELASPQFAEIDKFTRSGSKHPETIRIYRIN